MFMPLAEGRFKRAAWCRFASLKFLKISPFQGSLPEAGGCYGLNAARRPGPVLRAGTRALPHLRIFAARPVAALHGLWHKPDSPLNT